MRADASANHLSARGIRSFTHSSHHRLNTGSVSAAVRIMMCELLVRLTATGTTCARWAASMP